MGKGGGGGNGAAEAAAAREAARRSRIAGSIKAVKGRFFDPLTENPTQARLDSFADIEGRVKNRFLPEFQDTVSDARRELKFALARRGIFGGTAQRDAENRFADRIGEGEREIADRVLSARNEKERLDQSLLNSLTNQAQADIDQATLLSGIGSSFQSNNNRALTAATDQNLQTLFGDVGTLFKDINDSQALQRGFNSSGNNLGAIFGQNKGIGDIFASRTGGGGTVTN